MDPAHADDEGDATVRAQNDGVAEQDDPDDEVIAVPVRFFQSVLRRKLASLLNGAANPAKDVPIQESRFSFIVAQEVYERLLLKNRKPIGVMKPSQRSSHRYTHVFTRKRHREQLERVFGVAWRTLNQGKYSTYRSCIPKRIDDCVNPITLQYDTKTNKLTFLAHTRCEHMGHRIH